MQQGCNIVENVLNISIFSVTVHRERICCDFLGLAIILKWNLFIHLENVMSSDCVAGLCACLTNG